MDLTDWEKPDPAVVASPVDDTDWDDLFKRYRGSSNDFPFLRCIEVARSHGAKTVVIETRYADMDYRSEHHALYGRAFATIPSYAHRIHFFAEDLPQDLSQLPENHGYIGYIVVRPVYTGIVSRAMLPPPKDSAQVRCAVTEPVGFFGQRLSVTGVPFAQQDTRLGACAHAAAWVCHYSAHLRGEVARRPRADFALQADASLHPARAVPTEGLTVSQLSDILRRFGTPPAFYMLGHLPSPRLSWGPPEPTPPTSSAAGGSWDTRLFAVICRYLNSGFPVLVCTHDHAFVIVGWERDSTRGRILFSRHDDQRGPYLPVADPLDDHGTYPHGIDFDYRYWATLQVPLPPKLWLAPEPSERKAGEILRATSAKLATTPVANAANFRSLDERIASDDLALRTYAISSESFKQSLPSLGLDPHHVSTYRLARMPRYVWIVEAIDRVARDKAEPCVIGEAVVDATSAGSDPQVIAYRIHGVQVVQRVDGSVEGPKVGASDLTTVGGRSSST